MPIQKKAPLPDELRQDNNWLWLFEQVLMQYLEVNFDYTSTRFIDNPTIWQARYEEWLYKMFVSYWSQVCPSSLDSTFKSLISQTLKKYLIVQSVRKRLLASTSEQPSS